MQDYKAYDNVTGKTLQEYQQRWNRYYEPYPITDRCIEDIRAIEWKQFFQKMIKDHNLTKSQFQDIRTVLNGLFEYAVDLEIVESNRIRDLNSEKQYGILRRIRDMMSTRDRKDNEWSMSGEPEVNEDMLERSILENLADDIRISVKNQKLELTIVKELSV